MALQHLRSSTQNKRPQPASLSDGQLAVNTHNSSPGLFFKDSAGGLIKVGPVHVGTTAPNASPAVGGSTGNTIGEQWLDTTGGTYVFKVWDGTNWRSETGTFVDVNGDVMTGALGIIAGSAGAPGLYFSGNTNTGIYSLGTNQVAISTNGTGRLFVDASGNIGLGISAPGDFLHVMESSASVAAATGASVAQFERAGNAAITISTADTGASSLYFGDTASSTVGSIIYNHSSDSLVFGTSSAERARITSDGKLGLGTSAPSTLLDIIGTGAEFKGTNSTGINTIAGTEQVFKFDIAGQRNNLYASVGSIIFRQDGSTWSTVNQYNKPTRIELCTQDSSASDTSTTPRLVVKQDGKVGIGTTSPDAPLEVRSDGAGSAQIFRVARQNGADAAVFRIDIDADANEVKYASTGSTAGAHVWTDSVNERARIDSSGRLLVGTSSSLGSGSQTQVAGTGANFEVFRFNSTGGNVGASVDFARSGSSTVGTLAAVSSSQGLGIMRFRGAGDASTWLTGAQIEATVEPGTVSNTSMPTRLVFSTTADGGSAPTERVRITNDGKVGIGTTNPLLKLDVAESGATTVGLRASNSTGNFSLLRGSTGLNELRSSDTGSIIFSHSAGSAERARIDSSGRLLVGTSTSIANVGGTAGIVQIHGTTGITQSINNWATSGSDPARLVLSKSIGGAVGTRGAVASGNTLGIIRFTGDDGTDFIEAASISAFVDGTPGTDDMPGRIVLSTTADGANSPTERLRICEDGTVGYNQPAPAAVNATATLTVANLKTGIITSTSAAATDMTLPTGTLTEGGFSGLYTNFTFEWSVINTGPSLVRVLAATAHTIVGSGSVATGTSGRFASRRTAANTFVTYRLS